MIKRVIYILNVSRWYALPMSFFSWLIIFFYSIKHGGNIIYGLIALLGICSAHLATNLIDDYIDYHYLTKTHSSYGTTLDNAKAGKCYYLIDNSLSLKDIRNLILLYLTLAFLIFLFFYFYVGEFVTIFVISALFIILLYPFLSNLRLSEIAVALTYGPILFCGTNYVMCGQIDINTLLLSLPTMFFTVNLVFTDNILDKDSDKRQGKRTIIGLFKSNKWIERFHRLILISAYFSLFLIIYLNIVHSISLLVFITVPLSIDLLKSMEEYLKNSKSIPERKYFHFPMENYIQLQNNGMLAYMFRMYQARNIMIYSAVIFAITLYFL